MVDLFKESIPLITVIIAVVTFFISNVNARKAQRKAKEALEVAEKANKLAFEATEITRRRLRSEPLVHISKFEKNIDLTSLESLEKNFSHILQIKNKGEIAFENLSMELIGITPETYKISNPEDIIRPLPSVTHDVGLTVMIHPHNLANIDLRKPLISYLDKLSKQLKYKDENYRTVINLMLLPTAVGDPLPSGVSRSGCEDRVLLTIKFNPADFTKEKIETYVSHTQDLTHRVYPYSS
ncbi:TPA: hypothetical protein NKQ26_004778 [Vibrio parahaemolyticus]|uniref:hypothetical protein n=2 Tax=Vibrio parahaemolyticus TaxID=670 RepID=UPI00111D3255|nr:hypothetical protein [Vibrio parahaemolyticus]MBE4539985.1 hypothetical protein [Vibrio parahaemolyticus]MCI9725879.1 hypothetical protein [Vibrio parahaemolyticus]MCZ6395102.1 hypothetical protein [Vibrio parahaemolyticus]MDZ5120847.1 hypothetical protein [Vibrio parahaemolyticus]TOB16765.1 hypothetical protein CGK10_17695 [Vibrio parahaemolyticus]